METMNAWTGVTTHDGGALKEQVIDGANGFKANPLDI